MKLLADLQTAQYISPTNVRVIESFCQRWSLAPYEAVLETHTLTEHALADAIADIYQIDRIYSFDRSDVDLDALGRITYTEAKRLQCLAPHVDEKGTFQVLVLDPTDQELLSFLGRQLGSYRLTVIDQRLMSRSIEESYPLELQLPALSSLLSEKP